MALYSKKNPYPGINIHLNSFLQDNGSAWVSFHADHLTHLREYLDRNLPDPYYSTSESSLQIGEFDAGTGEEGFSRVQPDVSIFQLPNQRVSRSSESSQETVPTGTITIADTITINEDDLLGLVIYSIHDGSQKGIPIARVELLSPANKMGGAYHKEYSIKRRKTLEAGLRLIEIDYLHASRPVIHNLPSYRDKQAKAYPYVVLVSDPRPSLSSGQTTLYAWNVEEVFPSFLIPLVDDESVIVNLGEVYNYTYETMRLYHRTIDYAQDPINFDTYTDEDKIKIRKMLADIRHNLSTQD